MWVTLQTSHTHNVVYAGQSKGCAQAARAQATFHSTSPAVARGKLLPARNGIQHPLNIHV
jgi:hypothetical protein